MAFRFVHAADIHLDSPLRSLALRNPELPDLIGNATRRAFVNIVDLCIDERVSSLFYHPFELTVRVGALDLVAPGRSASGKANLNDGAAINVDG